MATERDQAFIDRYDKAWQAAWNEGKLDALDEFTAPDYIRHNTPFGDIVGLEGLKKFIADVRTAYPDWHLSYDGGFHKGDFSAGHGACHGTLTGKSPTTGVQGGGQKVDFAWCEIDRWVDGKIAEAWIHNDYLTLLRQTGAIPKPG